LFRIEWNLLRQSSFQSKAELVVNGETEQHEERTLEPRVGVDGEGEGKEVMFFFSISPLLFQTSMRCERLSSFEFEIVTVGCVFSASSRASNDFNSPIIRANGGAYVAAIL
jgi:hypothetical protein